MTVLQIGPYPPPHGGVQTNIVGIRDFLRQSGNQALVINNNRYRKREADGVFYPRTAAGMLKLLLGLQYDLVHLHIGGDLSLRLLALAAVCGLLPHKKSVLTFHSGGYPSSAQGRTARYWTVRGFVFRRFDAIIAVNQEILSMFKRFGVKAKRLRLILPFAVPPIAEDLPFPEPLRTFLETHRPVLLSVGLLEPEYDLALQIETLGAIRARYPQAGLVIVGAGSLEQSLRETAAAQLWSDHILLCGDLPHSLTLRAITRADVLWRTTLYDGDAISVREALYAGTPVIATDNAMRPEGVRLIPVHDSSALEDATFDVLGRPERAQESRVHGQENLQAVIDLYIELMRT